jgi:hypothetical protein
VTLKIQVKKRMAHMPHPQLLALCLTVKRMTLMMMMMMTAGKFCHLSNLLLFLSDSKNCLDLSICLLLILLRLLTFISFSQT